ncbi:ImmA/IrrE family metallo-endopeptidase [Nocardia cyriacigeorgica]|uniref:ImmA/IrrE family metallo-endopeptidase n=1 Tax=Nocardia cyriacigeorgica TaxID=135487 RepID=UPI0024565FCA|nr:ImmA/IrrE family metallo-endopeptidase [Nocardia cyriacigeorgica]
MGYYKGFKAEAERLAVETRKELRLTVHERLDPRILAEHLAIPVLTLGDLHARCPEMGDAVRVLHGEDASTFSGLTLFDGSRRVIVHNEAHTPGRQASDIAHELSHGLRIHPPAPIHDGRGCRQWNADHEDEANYLAGALLIPAKAAWGITKQRMSLEEAAWKFGCSIEMVRWRINITGARRMLAS